MSNESNVRSPLSWLLALAVPIVAVGGVLFGVIVLGRLAREHLGDQVRIEFKEIEVIPPPGIAREDFLDDVKNYADHAREPIPESIDPSDEPVKKLLAVFVCHPLVEEVIAIKILPERRIRVQLRYRTPVLSVEQNGTKRAVDKRGFRLPDTVPTEGLPVLRKAGPLPFCTTMKISWR
jgi:hypothetical protein